ncbi:unnamed protein product, partial [Dicrocoelium dendriticum]
LIYLLLAVNVVFNPLEVAGFDNCSEPLSKVIVECLEESVFLCGIEFGSTMVQHEDKCMKYGKCLDALVSCKIKKLAPLVYCRHAQYIRQYLINQKNLPFGGRWRNPYL